MRTGVVFFLALVGCVCAEQMAAPFRAPLDKRQSCVTCPANPPACPACPAGQECQITSQSCQQCAQSQCISSSTLTTLVSTTAGPPPKSNTGAIAGGIVGALVLAGLAAGVLFWYIRKKKQATEEMDMWLSSAHTDGSVEKDPSPSAGRKSLGQSSSHVSIATTMTHASNVIPIGYIPSPLRGTMMSSDSASKMTHDSMSSLPSPRSHPPTQFFSADDILRASLATNTYRDTTYSARDTLYSTNRDTTYSNRDSVGTTYTRGSMATNAYRSTAIIAAAPVPVAVRAQPKIITFGKPTTSPIPAVPQLTAEKVAEAERSRATNAPAATTGLGLNIPISISAAPASKRVLSTISSVPSEPTTARSTMIVPMSPFVPKIPESSPFEDEILESPVLGNESSSRAPSIVTPSIVMPISPSESSFGDIPIDIRMSHLPSSAPTPVPSVPIPATPETSTQSK